MSNNKIEIKVDKGILYQIIIIFDSYKMVAVWPVECQQGKIYISSIKCKAKIFKICKVKFNVFWKLSIKNEINKTTSKINLSNKWEKIQNINKVKNGEGAAQGQPSLKNWNLINFLIWELQQFKMKKMTDSTKKFIKT